MKAKNQQPFTSESDAKEKLIVYVYEYLVHTGAKQAADLFKENIGYTKEIKINETPGFLFDWWCVFWDLYCAAPERRHTQPESSSEARAFHDLMRTPMSPSITQSSPPQHPQQPLPPPPPQFMAGGPRYGPLPGQPRGPMPRMLGPIPHGPHPGGPPPGSFMPASSPRYAQHSGPPLAQPPMFGPGQPMGAGQGPPPQVNPRNTPQGSAAGNPGPGAGGGNVVQGAGGGGNVGQGAGGGWQSNVNYNVNSPANQPCYPGPGSNQPPPVQGGPIMMSDGTMMDVKNSPIHGGEPSTPHSDEYVMPVPFGQETNDQCDSAEIMKLKQSMQEDTAKMFEKEQSEFLGDYSDSQGKWTQ